MCIHEYLPTHSLVLQIHPAKLLRLVPLLLVELVLLGLLVVAAAALVSGRTVAVAILSCARCGCVRGLALVVVGLWRAVVGMFMGARLRLRLRLGLGLRR